MAAAPAPGLATGPAKAARPWFKKKRFLIPAGIVALAVFGSALSGGGDDIAPVSAAPASATPSAQDAASDLAAPTAPAATPSTSQPAKPAASPAPKPAKPASELGKRVRDGKFQFTVTSVKCGITVVGNSYLNTKAQGQFCAVQLTVANIGDEAQSMFATNQNAFDSKGRKFSADAEASIYDNQSQVLWEEINPGNAVKGKVYFDVPKGTKLTKLELHDSMFSGGASVRLG
jgi:hypothetical protein